MNVNDVTRIAISTESAQKNKPSEKELKKAAHDFAAVFYEKMLAGMLKTNTGQKGLQEDIWWDLLSKEIAGKISASSNTLEDELFRHLKKY